MGTHKADKRVFANKAPPQGMKLGCRPVKQLVKYIVKLGQFRHCDARQGSAARVRTLTLLPAPQATCTSQGLQDGGRPTYLGSGTPASAANCQIYTDCHTLAWLDGLPEPVR